MRENAAFGGAASLVPRCPFMPLFSEAFPHANEAGGGVVLLLLVLGVCLAAFVYFLPSFVAGLRGHQNAPAIFVLNLLLGWSFIGWAVALVWAFTEVRRQGAPDEPARRGVGVAGGFALAFAACAVTAGLVLGGILLLHRPGRGGIGIGGGAWAGGTTRDHFGQ